MGLEIERKFLVRSDAWRGEVRERRLLRQGYLANTGAASIRVRVADRAGWISVKAMTPGVARAEYEYPVPLEEANEMLDRLCEGPRIEKWRHLVPAGPGLTWEIDEFLGDNAGLVVAELELPDESTPVPAADWLGADVTHDVRYYNFRLARDPWKNWGRP